MQDNEKAINKDYVYNIFRSSRLDDKWRCVSRGCSGRLVAKCCEVLQETPHNTWATNKMHKFAV